MSRGPDHEDVRKLVHVALVAFAFSLSWLAWWQAAGVALLATLYNGFLFGRVHGTRIFRETERADGFPRGLVYYPLSIFVLLVVFRDQLVIVGAVWAVMALGDGFATLVGRRARGGRIPWNPRKSWAGTFAFLVAGSLGASALSWFLSARTLTGVEAPLVTLVVASVLATLAAALLESVETGVDDNLVVPFSAACVYWMALRAAPGVATSTAFWTTLAIGVGVSSLMGGLAFLARSVDLRGLLAGIAVGALVWSGGGAPAFLTLLAFFVLGVGATKIGFRYKAARGLAEARGGRRSAIHAIANGLAGAMIALASSLVLDQRTALLVGFVGAFATAAADTVSSEIGKRFGRRAFLPTTFRPVPSGTEGAISVEGTLAGVMAAVLVSAVALAGGLIAPWAAVACTVAAVAGNHLESLAGHLFGAKDEMANEVLNFLNTAVGALIAVVLAGL